MSASLNTDLSLSARLLLLVLLAVLGSGCASLSQAQLGRIDQVVEASRPADIDCDRADACADPSPLHELAGRAFAESTTADPRHYTLLLDSGSDALLARLDLIRSATTGIDLQTYIFDEDDAGRLVLEELIAAARRGVRVRLLMDQLSALKRPETLAALAGMHDNLQVRVYNPVLGRAKINYPQYLWAALCCWNRLNERMHNKLLVIDGAVGIAGGRNYQDDYYDWDESYNFRDRDLVVAGPAARDMGADFERYWQDRRSVPVQQLTDVGRLILEKGVPVLPPPAYEQPARVAAAKALAEDPALIQQRLVERVLPVGAVEYVADIPGKPEADDGDGNGGSDSMASRTLYDLIFNADERVMLQTPYLVLSDEARGLFRSLRRREDPPRVIVSTNSLAATDAFIAYALSYKYKRRYLRDYGFNIYEYKPFPQDAPIDPATTGAIDPDTGVRPRRPALRYNRGSIVERHEAMRRAREPLSREFTALAYGRMAMNAPVPLERAGVRMGLHAKSLVIDDEVGVVGTHNFDPRGERYNTESVVVIRDPAFARQLAASIQRDISPANSWVIAPREEVPVLSDVNNSVARVFEKLPLFDLWPVRYATSYEYQPSPRCPEPVPPDDPRFRDCYRAVGDFPEVALGWKSVLTRIFTAFGAGLAPIL